MNEKPAKPRALELLLSPVNNTVVSVCATRAASGGSGPFARLGSIENFHLWGGNFGFLRFFGTARAWGNYRTIFFHDIYA